LLTALATALVLTLETGAQGAPPKPAWAGQASSSDPDLSPPPLRSALWIPAGGYGLATTFAGPAAILTEYGTRRGDGQRNIGPPLIAMGVGFLVGLVPGLILGNNARQEDESRNRGAVGVLDLAGSAAMFFAFTQIYRKVQ